MAVKQDFLDYMTKHDFQPDQALEVAATLALIDITTVKDFVVYFSTGPTVFKFWAGIPEWKGKGSYLAQLRDMLLTLQDNAVEARERESLILDRRIDNPIDRKTHDTLTKVWLSRYGIRLHPTQEATNQIMGSMLRALQTRQTMKETIKSLRTIHSTQVIEPEKKLMKMGDFNLLHPEQKRNDKVCSIGSSHFFVWLMSREVFLRTLCKAGSYMVTDPEDDRPQEEINLAPQVPNIDRKHIE